MESQAETETSLTPFAIIGLYRLGHPEVFMADDEAHARRQFHDKYPGWAGTILKVFAPEEEAVDDDE